MMLEAPNGMFFEPKLKVMPVDGKSIITSNGVIEKLVICP